MSKWSDLYKSFTAIFLKRLVILAAIFAIVSVLSGGTLIPAISMSLSPTLPAF